MTVDNPLYWVWKACVTMPVWMTVLVAILAAAATALVAYAGYLTIREWRAKAEGAVVGPATTEPQPDGQEERDPAVTDPITQSLHLAEDLPEMAGQTEEGTVELDEEIIKRLVVLCRKQAIQQDIILALDREAQRGNH